MEKLTQKLNTLFVLIGLYLAIPLSGQQPVNPNASPEAKALLQFLYDSKGNGIITGNHNEQQYPTEWDDKLKAKNGNVEPAMYGNDFRYGNYVQYRQNVVDEIIRQHSEKGKIITMMYHQVQPMDAETEGWDNLQGELTWSEFEGLLTDGDPIHEAWEDKMDNIAYYLQQLEDQRIPVLFRPYHEMNGEWFWWGAKKSGDQYKRLFRMTYDYLTYTKGLDNILWVLNYSNVNDDLASYHPGDAYVDAIATDIYEASFTTSHYNALKNIANGKPIAVGEVGKILSMSEMQSTYPDYVWFMGWRSIFVDNNTSSELSNIFNSEWAINTYNPGSGTTDPPSDPPNGNSVTIRPVADTYSDESKSTTNFGTATEILIKGDIGNYDREGFLKFNISSYDINQAVLRLYCTSNSGATVDHSIFGIDDDSWSETSLTWSNAPQIPSTAIATTDVSPAGTYYEWDVSNYVLNQTDGTVSLALVNESDLMDKVLFASREASSNKPELVLYLNSDDTNTPVYALSVANGSGDGDYEEGTVVNISADAAPSDQQFAGWTGDISYVNDANSANTTVTIPASNVSLTASYENIASDPEMVSLPYVEIFDVIGGEFVANDYTSTWESPVIDISSVGSADITMDYYEDGDLDASGEWIDYVKVYTSLNGGSNILKEEIYGLSGKTSITINNISGSALKITLEAHTTSSSEIYKIDNLNVGASSQDGSPGDDPSNNDPVNQDITPIADSYVSESSSTTNYGSEADLYIKGDAPDYGYYDREGYLKFNVSSFSQIDQATLRLYCTSNDNGSIDHAIFGIDDDSWTENGITWSNAPANSGQAIAVTDIGNAGMYYEWDITSYVTTQTDGIVSLALVNESDQMAKVYFAAKENGSNVPQLRISGTLDSKAGKLKDLTSESNLHHKLLIYPNPSSNGNFKIQYKEELSSLLVSIYDLQGKVVYHKDVCSEYFSKTMETGLNKGMYIIKITTDKQQISKPFIIK